MQKTVWFFRHAQSVSNIDKDFKANDSSISVPLSLTGFKQAEELVSNFSTTPDLIVTSPFIRTKQTAEPLIKKYPAAPKVEWPIQEFTYLSLDRCLNTTMSERKPLVEEYWQKNDPAHWDGKGAETFTAFINRVQDTIEKIKSIKERFIVLFGHEYFIGAVRYILEKNPKDISSKEMREFIEDFLSSRIPNATKIEFLL